MNFNYYKHAYNSKRNAVFAKNGMVATSVPLAANAGIEILKKGGNAIDAAIATAAALTVVEPTSNGIGGDAFALIYTDGKLHGLNGSGPAPGLINIDKVKKRGYDKMPSRGFVPVTVPGAPKAWAACVERFGNLTLKEVLEPAIRYARDGFVVSPTVAFYWQRAVNIYKKTNTDDKYKQWFEVFTVNEEAPAPGEIFKSKWHADTLEKIAKTNSDAFYKGELSDEIDKFSKTFDGFLRKDDLDKFDVEWVDPISVNYKGYDIWEIPPNGQGITALMALNILNKFEFKNKDSLNTYHKQIEALKITFQDTLEHVTDLSHMKVSVDNLLSDQYAENATKSIFEKAVLRKANKFDGGTVYLATADNEGNFVSFIQSNYMGFGSGLVVPNTGISLQNRGHSFSLDENHSNSLKPNKKTYHTIIPGFITKDNEAIGPFGVMGGFMQPQGHVQVLMNMIDFNLNPQEALDAPRFRWDNELNVSVENSFRLDIAKELEQAGHKIKIDLYEGGFGRGQIIIKTKKGTLVGGTESRCDGYISVL